ncbi:hypothetical protein ABK040_002981 [Willaertia magna]
MQHPNFTIPTNTQPQQQGNGSIATTMNPNRGNAPYVFNTVGMIPNMPTMANNMMINPTTTLGNNPLLGNQQVPHNEFSDNNNPNKRSFYMTNPMMTQGFTMAGNPTNPTTGGIISMGPNNPMAMKRPKIEAIQLPEKLKDTIPESEIYSQLLDFEHRLDTLLSEKKQRIRQLLIKTETSEETLRIFISHQKRVINKNEEEWKIAIQGGIVRNQDNQQIAEIYRFTSFIKNIVIELDRDTFQGEDILEWSSPPIHSPKDGFTFVRKVNVSKLKENLKNEFPLKVVIHLKQDPPLYNLTNNLRKILNSRENPLPENNQLLPLNRILTLFWDYVVRNQLNDSEDKTLIKLDNNLKELINNNEIDKIGYLEILKYIKPHLLIPLEQTIIQMVHNISLDQNVMSHITKTEVTVETPRSTQQTSLEKLLSEEPSVEIEQLNVRIQQVIQQIKQHADKLKFMNKFSKEPINTIHQLIESQTRDLLILHKKQGIEEARKSSFYKSSEWLNQALQKYINFVDEKYGKNKQ